MDYLDDYMNDISHQFFNNNLRNCIIGPLLNNVGKFSKFPPIAEDYYNTSIFKLDCCVVCVFVCLSGLY